LPSKSNASLKNSPQKVPKSTGLLKSLALHGCILASILPFYFQKAPEVKEEINFTVVEKIKVDAKAPAPPTVEIEKPKPPEPKAPPRKKVFGVAKKSLVSKKKGAVAAKKGNTLAKTPDKEVLDDDDDESLPIPAEEFLISAMPKVLEEVRPQYPAEEKKKGIEGSVILDILIDAEGKVRKAQVIQSLTPAMDAAAQKAMKEFVFQPAKVGENSVAVKIKYSIRFVLE